MRKIAPEEARKEWAIIALLIVGVNDLLPSKQGSNPFCSVQRVHVVHGRTCKNSSSKMGYLVSIPIDDFAANHSQEYFGFPDAAMPYGENILR